MFGYQASLNININADVKKRKENLIHVFTVKALTHNVHKKVFTIQTNTASKS